MGRHLHIAAACGALVALAPGLAFARDNQTAFQFSLGPYGSYMRATPQLDIGSPTNLSSRTLAPGTLPSTGPLTLAGVGFDIGLTLNDHLIFPLFGGGVGFSVGDRSRVLASIDGSIVEMRPWTSVVGEVLLPGIGMRWKEHRWMFQAVLRTGVGIMGMDAYVADGASSIPVSALTASFLLRGEVSVCRRVDPADRACLYVAPTFYEFGWANGGSLGLRWEWGQ